MKILLILGKSGSGKTTIAEGLCKDKDKYHFIDSYTDRPKRDVNETGHTFVDRGQMDVLLKGDDVVASTEINGKRYCTIKSQFDENRVNVYIVDLYGINDTIEAFPDADIMTLLVTRETNDINDEIRMGRDVALPVRDDVDFVLENSGSIESSVGTVNVLVNLDLFSKPARHFRSIEEALDMVNRDMNYLENIEMSLEKQLWYRDESIYKQITNYVNNQLTNYDATIIPYTEPIYEGDGYVYPLIARYTESKDPIDVYRLIELINKYAYQFCFDNNYEKILSRLYISAEWVDDYYE